MKENKTIRNCQIKLKKKCSYNWENLEITDEEKIRYCSVCERNVYFCETDEETMYHAEENHCIARLIPDSSELPKFVAGEPDIEWVRANMPTSKQEEALAISQRERNINDALDNIKFTSFRCKLCGYPVPFWWKSCRVCGSSEVQEKS